MTSVALYAIAAEYRMLLERLSDADLDTTTIADTIEASGLIDDITLKAQGIECVARTLEMHTPAIDCEIERLQALKANRAKKAHGLREYLKLNMIACGIERIESPLFKIRIQNNPQAVEVYEPGLITSKYMTVPVLPPPAPDKAAIKAALKSGIDVQGARLTQGQRLVVS